MGHRSLLSNYPELLRKVEIVCRGAGDGEYKSGEWMESATVGRQDRMVAIPMTPGQLRNMPWGEYTTEDMKFYHGGAPRYGTNDAIRLDGKSYKIREITDRSFEGGYTLYLGKRQD